MCKEHRPYEEFCKLKRSPDGLYFRCRECNKQASAEYRAKNPDKMRQLDRAWYERNREKKVEYSSNWNANNREKYRVNKNASNRKRAAVMTRLPSWTTNELIVKFYEEAANLTESTGIKHSVDHIVPLNSKKVCGLHCHTNLRVIPLDDNVKKGNRSWPDMP
jgi:hypothetical protein